MSFRRKIRKLFIGGKWHIAFRKANSSEPFTAFKTPRGVFCADPIAIQDDNKTYVFCEQFKMRSKKGCIGYFVFDNGMPINKGIIIEKPYHMSYPFVFFYGNNYYMIPETSENKTVELYVADSFPHKWRLKNTLLSGKDYVDTTVWVDKQVHFVTYYGDKGGYILEEYCLDESLSDCKLIHSTFFIENVGRGAGAIFEREGVLFRPSQNCKRAYGESIILNKLDFSRNRLTEAPVGELSIKDIIVNIPNVIAVHTYALVNKYEIIDVFEERIDCTFNIGSLLAKKRRRKKLEKN